MTIEIIASHQIKCAGLRPGGFYDTENKDRVDVIVRTTNDAITTNIVDCPYSSGEHSYKCSMPRFQGFREDDYPTCPYSSERR